MVLLYFFFCFSVSATHKETKQFFTLYNTLDDKKVYLEKEVSSENGLLLATGAPNNGALNLDLTLSSLQFEYWYVWPIKHIQDKLYMCFYFCRWICLTPFMTTSNSKFTFTHICNVCIWCNNILVCCALYLGPCRLQEPRSSFSDRWNKSWRESNRVVSRYNSFLKGQLSLWATHINFIAEVWKHGNVAE